MEVEVLIVIVNYNCYKDTILCIKSLLKNRYQNYDLMIIDNCSTGKDFQILKEFLPHTGKRFTLKKTRKNIGFAGAVNIGLRYALKNSYRYILLINPDTVVSEDFLDRLLETIKKDRRTGIVGCKILFKDTGRIFFAGGSLSYFRNIGHNSYYNRKDSRFFKGEVDCTFVSGCLMLIRRELIEEIGFFDEDYFMYVEDVDFCYRALKKGWKIKTNLNVVIFHKGAGSSDEEFSFYWSSKNRLRFIFKNLKGLELLKALYLHILSKLLLYIKLVSKPRLILADMKGMIDYFRLRNEKGLS